MPGGDRSGPVGYDPMTGRHRGYCSGYQEPEYWHPGLGLRRGFGRGPGLGRARGWRHFGRFGGYAIPLSPLDVPYEGARITPDKELDHLKEESDFLKEELNRIEQKINELEREEK